MKTISYFIVAVSIALASCKGCKEEVEPAPDYTEHCQEGMVWNDQIQKCVDTVTFHVDTNGVQIFKNELDDYYVSYNSGYLWMERFFYIVFCDSFYLDWPNNPEQMYPCNWIGPHANIIFGGGAPAPRGQTTFLDPVRGDSIIFHVPVWNDIAFLRFEGRFTPDRYYINGDIQYRWHPISIAKGYDTLMTLPSGRLPITFQKYRK